MPNRRLVAKELGSLLKVISNPDRILIVHALAANGESDVNDMAARVGISPTRTSQHLGMLRAFQLVSERSEGRRRVYSLAVDALPDWLMQGVDFVADWVGEVSAQRARDAKAAWLEGSNLPPE
ncbi:MAG: metalloregulator ArsR/SmtB family transcription factor [Pseudomonadota bacterium]